MTSKFQDLTYHKFGYTPNIIQRINFHTLKELDNRYAKELSFGQTHQVLKPQEPLEKIQEEETFEIHTVYEDTGEQVNVELNKMVQQKPVPFVNTNMFLKKNTKSIF